jgi:4-hydroxybenzoate polyprenyltransferase
VTTGAVSVREALLLGAALALLAFGLVLTTNPPTILLSFGALAVALIYPYAKRVVSMPQAVLGVAFSFGIPMAFSAALGGAEWRLDAVPRSAWALLVANLFWVLAYDTEYAMVDRDEDIAAGAKSTAILFGDADLPILGVLMGTFLLTMLFVGQRATLGWPYWLGLWVAAGLFGYQLWTIRGRARDACLSAFRHNNWLGLAIWISVVLALAVR